MFVSPLNAKIRIVQPQHVALLLNLKDVETIASRPAIPNPDGISIPTVPIVATAIGSASMFPTITL